MKEEKDKDKKREKKLKDKKERKKVFFNEDQNEILEIGAVERKWNDHLKNKANLVQGSFKLAEIKVIMNSICQYAKLNNLSSEGLLEMCSKPAKELS